MHLELFITARDLQPKVRRRCKPQVGEASEASAEELDVGEKGSSSCTFQPGLGKAQEDTAQEVTKLTPERWCLTEEGDLCVTAIFLVCTGWGSSQEQNASAVVREPLA